MWPGEKVATPEEASAVPGPFWILHCADWIHTLASSNSVSRLWHLDGQRVDTTQPPGALFQLLQLQKQKGVTVGDQETMQGARL